MGDLALGSSAVGYRYRAPASAAKQPGSPSQTARSLPPSCCARVGASSANVAGKRDQAQDRVEQRRLASSIQSDDGDESALVNVERDVFQRLRPPYMALRFSISKTANAVVFALQIAGGFLHAFGGPGAGGLKSPRTAPAQQPSPSIAPGRAPLGPKARACGQGRAPALEGVCRPRRTGILRLRERDRN